MDAVKISRFLIVDDDHDNAIFFKVLLMNQQFQSVTLAQSGREALEFMDLKRVQFVITAWEMKEMPGTVLVQRIRAMRQFRHVPIVIYSRQMSPDDVTLLHQLGLPNVLSFPVQEKEAIQIIKQLVAYEDNLDPTLHRIRRVEELVVERQYSQALNELKPALVKGPFFGRAQTLLGEIYLAQGQLEEAERALTAAIDDGEDSSATLQALAKVYSLSERHAEAIGLLRKMSSESPFNIEVLINLGQSYAEAERYDDARTTFERVRQVDPTNPRIDDELGKVSFREGNFTRAAELLQATQDADEITRYFNNLAVGLVNKAQFVKGIKTYEAALDIMQDRGLAHILRYNLGLALSKNGDLKRAFEVLRKCFEERPDYGKAYAAFVKVVKEMERKQIFYDRKVAEKLREIYHKSDRSA